MHLRVALAATLAGFVAAGCPEDPKTHEQRCDAYCTTYLGCFDVPEAQAACVDDCAGTDASDPCNDAYYTLIDCIAALSCDELAAFEADPGAPGTPCEPESDAVDACYGA